MDTAQLEPRTVERLETWKYLYVVAVRDDHEPTRWTTQHLDTLRFMRWAFEHNRIGG